MKKKLCVEKKDQNGKEISPFYVMLSTRAFYLSLKLEKALRKRPFNFMPCPSLTKRS